MAEIIQLGHERMNRMTTAQQIEHLDFLINKLNSFTIKSAIEMLDILRSNHKVSDKTTAICIHLIYVGFITGEEGADKTGDELLEIVDDNPQRYQRCLYRKLRDTFGNTEEIAELNPLKSIT